MAIARIFDDLIKADRIIDSGEMLCWKNICAKYSIDRNIEIEAGRMTLADAVASICNSNIKGIKSGLMAECKSMTVSDGFCAHSEAMLISALTVLFDDSNPFSGEIYSIPQSDFNIDMASVLFVENEFHPEINEQILNRYRSIFKEFQLAGFHFVYIPQIIKHYRETDPQLFKDILSFLSPTTSETGIEHAYKSLMMMTTDVFCKDLLCNKCGLKELYDTPPSLLIKIGSSSVKGIPFSNYLRLTISVDVLKEVQHFIDLFSRMQSRDFFVVNTSEERDNQFHFHGFYKQLLDIFLTRHNIRSRIIIDPFKEEIFFPDIDARLAGVHRREKALYTLFLCQGNKGLNFNRPKSVSDMISYDKRIESIQSRFTVAYGIFGGDTNACPDLSQPEIRRPIFSCLKRSVKNLAALYNPDDYNISKQDNNRFSVLLEPELVYVVQSDRPDPVPLLESDLYNRIYGVQ